MHIKTFGIAKIPRSTYLKQAKIIISIIIIVQNKSGININDCINFGV